MATVDKTCPGTSARQDSNGHEGVASFTDSPEMGVGVGSVASSFLSAGSPGPQGLRSAPGHVWGSGGPGVGEGGQVDLQAGSLFAPPDP